jgi:hypothetical protein
MCSGAKYGPSKTHEKVLQHKFIILPIFKAECFALLDKSKKI